MTLVMLFFVRRELSFGSIFGSIWKPLLASGIMLIVCTPLANLLVPSILNTLILVVAGVGVYGICILLLKDALAYDLLNKIKGKLKKGN